LSRGTFTLAATEDPKTKSPDATGLSRGVFTLAATEDPKTKSPDATGLSRGVSRSRLHSSERDSSTGQARGIQAGFLVACIAASVNISTGQARGISLYSRQREYLHGTSPWHLFV